MLPESLHTLILGDQVSKYNFKLPISLIVLICEIQIDPILSGMKFHEGLQELIFNGNVLVDLTNVILPKSIRTLKLGSPCRTSIKRLREFAELQALSNKIKEGAPPWPSVINSFIYYKGDMLFDSSRITHLTIGREHDSYKDQKPVVLRNLDLLCVQELTLGQRFNQNIRDVKFRDIMILYDYSNSININSCAFPNTLRKIIHYVHITGKFMGDDITPRESRPHVVYERHDEHNGRHTKAALHV
jgi:hypothetical protein